MIYYKTVSILNHRALYNNKNTLYSKLLFSGLISNHIINPISPPNKTKRNTRHPDLPLSDASDAAHILAIKPIMNQTIPTI